MVFAGGVSLGYIFTLVDAQANKIRMQIDKITYLTFINSIPFPPSSSPDPPPLLSSRTPPSSYLVTESFSKKVCSGRFFLRNPQIDVE
jgi:hypothetical protein